VAQGFTSVIGCDEVGRGPLAGPVVAGLVVWTPDILTWPEGLYDSKTVTEKRRGPLAEALRETFPQHALGESSAEIVDQEGNPEGAGPCGGGGIARIGSAGCGGRECGSSAGWIPRFCYPPPAASSPSGDEGQGR
jgi:ribonuclease HII